MQRMSHTLHLMYIGGVILEGKVQKNVEIGWENELWESIMVGHASRDSVMMN